MHRKFYLTLGVSAAVGLVWSGLYLINPSQNQQANAPASQVGSVSELKALTVVPGPRKSGIIAQSVDAERVRNYGFNKVGDTYRAEGVNISEAGQVEMTSQHTKGKIKQKLVSAFLGDEKRALPKNEKIKSESKVVAETGHVLLKSFFEGIDVEYRYDGKDIEEFFHLSEDLKQEVIKSGHELVIRSVIPGRFRKNGDELMSGISNLPLHAEPVPGLEGEASEFGANKLTGPIVLTTAEGHRFGFPVAVVFDENSHSKTLARTFEWTDGGLQVDVHLPAEWVKETAIGKVTIDPSIVDTGRGVRITTWNETNMVKDSLGRLHVAYSGIYNGSWKVLTTDGDAATGKWDAPQVVEPDFATSENQYYAPSLAIDSNDTLHVVWGDHGHIPDMAAQKGPYTSWGHRVRYAYCANRCDSGNSWLPTGSAAKLIASSTRRHQARYHVAVSGSGNGATANDAHVTWIEWGNQPSGATYEQTRHFQFRNGAKTELADIPPTGGSNRNRWATYLAWGADNALWAIMPQYEWSRDIRTYRWNGNNDSWTAGGTTKLWHPRNGGQNMHQYRLNCSANNGSLLHCAWNVYYWNGDNAWGIGYGAFNTANASWQDTQHVEVLAAGADFHNEWPAIASESQNVFVFWNRRPRSGGAGLYDIRGAFKPLGATSFGAATSITNPAVKAQRVRAMPNLKYPPHMNQHTGQPWDIVIETNGETLRHYRPGQGVSPPILAFPADGAYIKAADLQWIWTPSVTDAGDPNNLTGYTLEVATESSFTNVVVNRTRIGNGKPISENSTTWNPAESCYYWRVRATSPLLGQGPWSKIRHFCVDDTAPGIMQLTAPPSGRDPQTATPRFTWTPSVDPE